MLIWRDGSAKFGGGLNNICIITEKDFCMGRDKECAGGASSMYMKSIWNEMTFVLRVFIAYDIAL